jgi:glycosyltransferase involved in cell wall biosynthesis
VDVVHTHSEGPLLYGAAAARLARVPRVIHTRHHGPDLGNARHVLAMLTFATRWVDRVACVADDGARHAMAEGVAASKVVTVWNGIDLARFAYSGPVPGGPAVVVARLSPEKDHASLLRAVALVARVEPGFRLEIAGSGPCEAELKSLAGSLRLGDAVRFLGRVDDVPALLMRASLLVQPSLLEGIALTLLEAMARGLPVIATRVGGNPEVVVDGETGRLVPARSAEALAAAVLALWRDPEASRRLGRAGRDRAERCFDIRRTVARYEGLYCGINEPEATSSDPERTSEVAGPTPAGARVR